MSSALHAGPGLKPPKPEMGPYTWEDFVALDEDDLRELVDGHLVEIEVPTNHHEYIVTMLGYSLVGWALENGARVCGSGYKVRMSSRRGFMPDLQLYRKGNLPKGQEQGLVEGRPDLVVEIVSPSSARYDRVTKLDGYLSKGVPEYWLVHPDERYVERFVLTEGGYLLAESAVDDAVFSPASFPGLSIPLERLWNPPEDEDVEAEAATAPEAETP